MDSRRHMDRRRRKLFHPCADVRGPLTPVSQGGQSLACPRVFAALTSFVALRARRAPLRTLAGLDYKHGVPIEMNLYAGSRSPSLAPAIIRTRPLYAGWEHYDRRQLCLA